MIILLIRQTGGDSIGIREMDEILQKTAYDILHILIFRVNIGRILYSNFELYEIESHNSF